MSIKGIDISHHQRGLKMSSVKKAGFEYVILRVGYSGSKNHSQVMDETFADFYKAAREQSLYIGAYFYGCAFTKEEAKKEGAFVNRVLKSYDLDLPVYYDIEGDMLSKHKDSIPELIASFGSELDNNRFGVYMSDSPITSVMPYLNKKGISVWVARYGAKPRNSYDIWQYSSSNKIDGITVDTNTAECTNLKKLQKKFGVSEPKAKPVSKPKVEPVSKPSPKKLDIKSVALKVIQNKYGSGVSRKQKLEKEGYNYKDVQAEVNRLLKTDYYTVQLGDTLTAIANRKGITVQKLAEINKIENRNCIYVGQVLKLR